MAGDSAAFPIMALGERSLLEGFPLAGVRLIPAETDDEVRSSWQELLHTDGVLILTRRAAAALSARPEEQVNGPMMVVLP